MVYVGEAFRLPAVTHCEFAEISGEFVAVYRRDGKPVPYDNTSPTNSLVALPEGRGIFSVFLFVIFRIWCCFFYADNAIIALDKFLNE